MLPSTVGLLSTSLSGLTLGLRASLAASPWLRDPSVVPMPFRQDIYDSFSAPGRPLKIGMLYSNGVVEPHPQIRRGLKLLAHAVTAAGHRVVDWSPPMHGHGINLQSKLRNTIFFSDDGGDVRSQIAMPGVSLKPREPVSLAEAQALTAQAIEFRQQYADYWNSTAATDGQIVDAFIMPVATHSAVILGKRFYCGSGVVNLLNYTAVVIPVMDADKEVDDGGDGMIDDGGSRTRDQPRDDTWHSGGHGLDRANREAHAAETYHNAPSGVQIVGRGFEEEKILGIASVLEAALERFEALERQEKEKKAKD